MGTLTLPKLFVVFLLVEFVLARTITHYKTVTDGNGNTSTKTWTTTEDDDEPESPFLGIATPEELIKQAAVAKGMDPVAIDELLANRQPVIQTKTDEQGNVHTTTYKLEPDGTISRKTITALKPRTIHYPVSEKLVPANDRNTPDADWEWNPQRNPFNAPSFPRTYSHPWHREPPTFDYDDFFRPPYKPKVDEDEESETPPFNFNYGKPLPKPNAAPPEIPSQWNPWLVQPQGNGFPNSWQPSGFDDVDTNTPGTVTKTTKDENGNTITTTYTVGPKKWSTHSFNFPTWPEQNIPPKKVPTLVPTSTTTTTTTIKPATTTTIKNNNAPAKPKTPTLPNLEDFLKSQYGPTTTSTTSTSTSTSTSTTATTQETPKITTTVATKQPPKPTPLPSLEDFLRSQYGPTTTTQRAIKEREPTTPKTQPTTITKKKEREVPTTTPLPSLDDFLKSQHASPGIATTKHTPIEPTTTTTTSTSTTNTITPEMETTVRTFTKTVHSPQLPTAADLDPNMQDVLKRAGITPDDIKSANGDSITKTRVEPDGRTITTTYRVRTTPTLVSTTPTLTFDEPAPPPKRVDAVPHPYKPFRTWYDQPDTHDFVPPRPMFPGTYPNSGYPLGFPRQRSPIANFLYGIGLTIPELEAQRGEYMKTIVDEDGRALVIKLSLSAPVGR